MIVRIVSDGPDYPDGTVLITCVEGDIWIIWNGLELLIGEGYTCVIRPDGVLEVIPTNELPQEEADGVTDEDTSNGEDGDQQPAGSANGSLNNPPVAVRDTALTEVNTSITINVLNNDSDVDGDALTVHSVNQGSHGSVTNNGGDVSYSPNSGFTGTDHFRYTASDGSGGTDTATVTVFIIDVSQLEFSVTPPTDDESPPDGDETPPPEGEPAATFSIRITSGPSGGAIYIYDETAGGVYLVQGNELTIPGGVNFELPADHHYYIWLGGTYHPTQYPDDWTTAAPDVAPDAQAVYGSGENAKDVGNNPFHFNED